MTTHICDLTPSDADPESARDLLYRHALPEDVIDGVLCLHAQELATVQRREAAVWGVDTAAGKHILGAADLIDPTRTPPAAAPVTVPPTDRAGLSAKLWAVAEHHIVAEWICCEPLEPKHTLCAKGYAALGMARSLLVDADPEKAWNPAAPLLDAVLAELSADPEPHRLALSDALGLGTSAPWDAIRERAAELQAEVASLTEASRRLLEQRQEMAEERYAWQERGDRAEKRVCALEAGQAALSNTDRQFLTFALELAADQMASRGDEFGDGDTAALKKLRRLAAETPSDCPGYETTPNRCSCDCEGCRHNCAAHQAAETPGPETQAEAHPPISTWKVESPRRDNWASWGAAYDERDWAQERYESAIGNAPARPFRLVRATTTYTVEAEHTPATETQVVPPREPHPTEADLRHALAVAAKFHGQAATTPAVVAEPGKENDRG